MPEQLAFAGFGSPPPLTEAQAAGLRRRLDGWKLRRVQQVA